MNATTIWIDDKEYCIDELAQWFGTNSLYKIIKQLRFLNYWKMPISLAANSILRDATAIYMNQFTYNDIMKKQLNKPN